MTATPNVPIRLDWSEDLPRSVTRHVLFGIVLLMVAFGGFGLWAFRAPLSAAVLAPGSFVATGRNKIVQHLEGGIIDAILVNEGDHVTAGQPLHPSRSDLGDGQPARTDVASRPAGSDRGASAGRVRRSSRCSADTVPEEILHRPGNRRRHQ